MRHLLLGMALVLSAQTMQGYAEENRSFDFEDSLVQEIDLGNIDSDSLARSKSYGSYSLPQVGQSLTSTSAYAITAAAPDTLISRALLLTVNARHNKRGLYEITISNADAVAPAFSHTFLIGRIGNSYFGQSLDTTTVAGTASNITIQQYGRDLEVVFNYVDITTGTISQTVATFRLNRS